MKLGRRNLGLNYDELHERYLLGESSTEIAASVGIDAGGLRRAWARRGLVTRPIAEVAALRAQNMQANVGPAHAARRGNTDPMERRVRRAITREERMLGTSRLEDMLAAYLDDLRVRYVRQKAIGPYNVDFALPGTGTVIEVDGGGHNPRVRANRAKRTEYIESHGWYVVNLRLRRRIAGLALDGEDEDRLKSALRSAAAHVPRPLLL